MLSTRATLGAGLKALLLSSCLAGGAFYSPVFAEERAARTPMILSRLPAPSSEGYKALRALAGEATGQALEMTKSEMWSVPTGNVEALEKAAAGLGVEVMLLDESWNHPLKPMSSGMAMTEQQTSMMHDAMRSKAAMGMSMGALPDPKVLEYALTKGMDDPAGDPAAATLVIQISETQSITVRRTHVGRTADGYSWHGTVEGTDEPVSFMWWPAGRLTGQVTYLGHVYVVKHMGGALHGVVEMTPKAMPPEHAPMDSKAMKRMNMSSDPLVKEGDADMLRAHTRTKGRQDGQELQNQQDAPLRVDPGRKLGRGPVTAPPRGDATGAAGGDGKIEIALIVAYTRAAARHYTDIEKDLIELAVADTNQSFRASGITSVEVKLVHAYQTGYREKGSHFEHVFAFADKGDGKMDAVHRLRDKYKADVALLIVDDGNGCGLAAGVAPEADRAFAVVHHECAAVSYSLAHEIGHIIGARHDIGLDDSKNPFPFGHGFVHGKEWRTMMSYEESCGKCPRLPIWSSPGVRVKGVAAGDELANNARVISENAARVAQFR